jgi:hypothetical protein
MSSKNPLSFVTGGDVDIQVECLPEMLL